MRNRTLNNPAQRSNHSVTMTPSLDLIKVPIFVSAHKFWVTRKARFKRHAINYATKYTTDEWKQTFPNVTKSSLMSLYLNQEYRNSSKSLATNW